MPANQPQDLGKALGHVKTDKRIDILRQLDAAGSISEAARRSGVSYKAAWQAIDILGNLAGTPLVEKVVGGSGGGGTRLTQAGKELLKASADLEMVKHQLLKKHSSKSLKEPLPKGMLGLQTTMRNQFPATVSAMVKKAGMVRVGLNTKGGCQFHALITASSAELFDMHPGLKVLVLFKATAVQIRYSAGSRPLNSVLGAVVRKSKGSHAGEVNVLIEPGITLIGFSEDVSSLDLGDEAYVLVDESALVLALPHDD